MDAYLTTCQSDLRKTECEGLELLKLSSETLNRRPAGGGWSAAECLAHLNTTNAEYSKGIAAAAEQARRLEWRATKAFQPGWLERLFLKTLEPGGKRKFKAPAVFLPPSGLTLEAIASEWRGTHQRLLDLLEHSADLDLKRAKVISPVNRFLRLSLGASFAVMAAHDRRHLLQAKHAMEN